MLDSTSGSELSALALLVALVSGQPATGMHLPASAILLLVAVGALGLARTALPSVPVERALSTAERGELTARETREGDEI
jgi:hypothetical protein